MNKMFKIIKQMPTSVLIKDMNTQLKYRNQLYKYYKYIEYPKALTKRDRIHKNYKFKLDDYSIRSYETIGIFPNAKVVWITSDDNSILKNNINLIHFPQLTHLFIDVPFLYVHRLQQNELNNYIHIYLQKFNTKNTLFNLPHNIKLIDITKMENIFNTVIRK
jgi:hypothetical protein